MYLISLYITALSKGVEQTKALSIVNPSNLNSNQIFCLIALLIILKNIGTVALQKYALRSFTSREAEVGTFIAEKAILESDDYSRMTNSTDLVQTLSSIIRSV
jgi:hypothetical protein